MTEVETERTRWLVPSPRDVAGDDVLVVLDAAWTPEPGTDPRIVSMRDAVRCVFRAEDPIETTSTLLDAWADASGIVERLSIEDTSFWYYVRLRHWLWLQDRVIWAWVLRRLLDDHVPTALVIGEGADGALADVARAMTEPRGLQLTIEGGTPTSDATLPEEAPAPVQAASVARPSLVRRIARRIRRALGASGARGSASTSGRRIGAPGKPSIAFLRDRLAALERETEPRLLVVSNHVPQRIETATGPRFMNAYLGPIADRLRGTRLEPIHVDMKSRRSHPSSFERMTGPGTERTLPADVLRVDEPPVDQAAAARALEAARSIAAIPVAVPIAGIDLGPGLAAQVSAEAATWFPAKHQAIVRKRALIDRLPVAGILIADEYHRQDWMAAASAAGVPIAAVQHGLIYRRHNGYMHAHRPPGLHLVDRTYVFGRWERDLLVDQSVYRDDEVRVGGSPRLDVGAPAGADDRTAVRREFGVAADARMIVLSGTHGAIYRRFHYPVALADLFDRPIPDIHVVVKLHPAETDEGPYRAVIEGSARARGFAPPPITVVQSVDLYRLLGAADAHLGIHSTVLTEAVVVGTPNLLATGVLGGDLLGYLDAGVALPVADGGDLIAALDRVAHGAVTPEARAAFVAQHFEPGSASERIADDLLAWLP